MKAARRRPQTNEMTEGRADRGKEMEDGGCLDRRRPTPPSLARAPFVFASQSVSVYCSFGRTAEE